MCLLFTGIWNSYFKKKKDVWERRIVREVVCAGRSVFVPLFFFAQREVKISVSICMLLWPVCVCVRACHTCYEFRILSSDIELAGMSFHLPGGWGLLPFSLRYFILWFVRPNVTLTSPSFLQIHLEASFICPYYVTVVKVTTTRTGRILG